MDEETRFPKDLPEIPEIEENQETEKTKSQRNRFNVLLSSYRYIKRQRKHDTTNHPEEEMDKTCKTEDLSIQLKSNSNNSSVDLPSPDSAVLTEDEDLIADISTNDQKQNQTPAFSRTSTRSISATFSEQFDTKDDISSLKGMTKFHYVDKKLRASCKNCEGKFNFRRRPRHCRRCGEVFCVPCVQFQRRLNKLAQPDPDGRYRKVCQNCYKGDAQEIGFIRSWTRDFIKERELSKCERIVKQRVNSKTQTFWRDQLDVEAECRRLLDGFERYVGASESKKAVQELQSLMTVPYWQKSRFWQVENVTRNCRQCKRGLGVRKSKRNCRVCSLALCKKCSNKELLIYYDDNIKRGQTAAKLALINVVGCPTKEPNISLLLHICTDCKAFIFEKQEDNHCWYESLRDDSPLAEINRMNVLFEHLTNNIRTGLQKVETEEHSNHVSKVGHKLSHLGLQLDEYHTLFKHLQNVLERAESKQQHLFVKNFTKGKYDFYMESRHEYRKLCKTEKDGHST